MITKVLIKLLETPVKPEHPIDFIRDNLGATLNERNRIEQLEQQVNDYQKEVAELKSQIVTLTAKLSEKECADEKSTENTVAADTTDPIAIVEAEKVTDTPSGGGKIDDTTETKIIESEKAVAPTSIAASDVPVIEAATADEQNPVSTDEVVVAVESTKVSTDKTNKVDGDENTKQPETSSDNNVTAQEPDAPKVEKNETKTEADDKSEQKPSATTTPTANTTPSNSVDSKK